MDRPPTTANASRLRRPSAGRRAAAAGALLAVAVVVGWSVIRNPLQLLLALLLIVVVALAGWTTLLHHGLTRLLAAIMAVAALAGLVALPDVRSLMFIVVVAGLVLIATAAARVAIGRDLVFTGGARQVGPARHGVLLMNPWSGGGKVTRFGLADTARERGVTPIVLHRGDDLHTLAVEAAESGADVLGMAGGDGSQALVADVARRHGIPFVCVPAGTRNHFALDLGLNRADVAAALDAFGEAIERRVDLATVGGRVFVNNASLGVYATVVQSDGYRDAKMSTTARLLPELLGPEADRPDLRFTRPDGANVQTADVVLVSNGAYRLDSLNGFGSRARLDGGVLGVVTVTVNRARRRWFRQRPPGISTASPATGSGPHRSSGSTPGTRWSMSRSTVRRCSCARRCGSGRCPLRCGSARRSTHRACHPRRWQARRPVTNSPGVWSWLPRRSP
jgi:diacylglycerol kinase-like protein